MADFKQAISKVLKNEGGYVDNPNDLGGTTNFGISLRFLQSIDKTATKETIKNLTLAKAEDLYFKYFWLPNKYDQIDYQSLANKVFDTAVNTGSKIANRILQSTLNTVIFNGKAIKEDGIIGNETINAINYLLSAKDVDSNRFKKIYMLLQKEYYASIVANKNNQVVFLKGWLKRAEEI